MGRAAGVATRPAESSVLCGDALDGDAEPVGLVDEVVGDARAGECDDALGQEGQEFVVAPEGSRPSVCVPVWLADDLVDAVTFRPAGRYLLRAGAAAVDEDDVCVLGLELVEVPDDGAHIVRLLAARDGDEGTLGEVGGVLAVLARPLEVARVDHGRGELAGLRGVGAAPWPPDLAGLDAVGLGGGVSQLFEGIAAVREVLRPVGREFEFAGADLGAVCSRCRSRMPGMSLSAARSRRRVWASRVLTKPHRRFARSSASCVPSGAACARTWKA